MKRIIFAAFYLGLLGVLTTACNPKEQAAETPETTQPTPISEEETAVSYDCKHCGMPSKDFPKWNTKITTTTGEQWTCSPRCMFLLTQKEEANNISEVMVIDYYETKEIDGKAAFYVIKSTQTGPMGHDFVPFASREAAQEFMKDYAGEQILTYDEVTPEIIESVVNHKAQ